VSSSSLHEHFGRLPDPRMERQKRHLLMDVLFISICAVICGATSFVEMEQFGKAKLEWFRGRLELPNGIPSHDTFRRVFSLIEPEGFLSCFVGWTQAISRALGGDIIAFDGKCLRRSFDSATGLDAVHVLNAWSCANNFCLGQMKVDGKSNEITAMPELLKLIEIKGSVVTADALHCQKEIANQIVEQGGAYVLAVKGNQPLLHEDIKLFFEDSIAEGFEVRCGFRERVDYGHGRTENRRYWAVPVSELDWFKHTGCWRSLASIACVESARRTRDGESVERRYFITSLTSISKIARSIRCHWNVENSLHWVLDVDFDEDLCRVRVDHAPANFALLRQIAHNLIKQETTKKISVRCKIKKAGWDNDFLARIVAGV
jgi:predicted transposase YbfD/YdcC